MRYRIFLVETIRYCFKIIFLENVCSQNLLLAWDRNFPRARTRELTRIVWTSLLRSSVQPRRFPFQLSGICALKVMISSRDFNFPKQNQYRVHVQNFRLWPILRLLKPCSKGPWLFFVLPKVFPFRCTGKLTFLFLSSLHRASFEYSTAASRWQRSPQV